MNPNLNLRPTPRSTNRAMCTLHRRSIKSAIAAAALYAALPSFAASCTELQAEVEAKIRNGGVSQFTITIVDANAADAGKVVGTCEMGAKKLIYTLAPSANTVAFAPPVAPTPKVEAILTECRDGSVSMGGSCQ